MGRRFEFIPDATGMVVKGKIAEQFSQNYLENMRTQQFTGRRWKAMLYRRTVTKIGREPYDQYTLLELEEIEQRP